VTHKTQKAQSRSLDRPSFVDMTASVVDSLGWIGRLTSRIAMDALQMERTHSVDRMPRGCASEARSKYLD
jgi:hypothetical protein